MPHPSQRYFGRAHGRWSGTLSFAITSWRTFLASPMSLPDRLRILAVALVPPGLVRARLATRVLCLPDRTAPDTMVHRIWLSQWGVVTYRTEERFTLHPDGTSLTIEMTEYAAPRRWVPRTGPPSPGSIDPTAVHGHYRLPWFGTTVDVRTALSATDCEIVVTTPWARGVQRLRKISEDPGPDAP
jgi:hypothetical protein